MTANQNPILRKIEKIACDDSLTLDDRMDELFTIRDNENWDEATDVFLFTLLIDRIKEEEALATHVADMLRLYVLLAETYARTKTFRPLDELSRDVRSVLRDDRIAWDVIDETLPRLIDVMEDSVYHHETYRLLLIYIDKAFKAGALNDELKGYVRNLLKLHILLEDTESWHNHLLLDMKKDIASLFTQDELLKIIMNPSIGLLKCDPVEYTYLWEDVYYDVEDALEERFANAPRHMGFCFRYWAAKQEYLKEHYGIDWKSPSQMNPRVMFD